MVMTICDNRAGLRETLLTSLVFLFFLQLLTIWIESIYRMSLVKLSMGPELLGILLPLLCLGLLFVGRRHERTALGVSFSFLLITRALCPLLPTPLSIVDAGLGVAAFLSLVCRVLTCRMNSGGGNMAAAVGIAVLSSVALRAWGSSCDLSMGGPFVGLGWALIAVAGGLSLSNARFDASDAPSEAHGSIFGAMIAALAAFANISIIYLVFSSPAVISAWSGSSLALGTVLLAVSFACVVGWCALKPAGTCSVPRAVLVVWNVAFILALVNGVYRLVAPLPESPASPPLFAGPAAWSEHILLYVMLVLSPVTLVNLAAVARRGLMSSARGNVLPVLSGMAFLVLVTMTLIFTNVWGYVGAAGPLLRNRFYVPFLVAGVGMALPLFLPVWKGALQTHTAKSRPWAAVLCACVLALLAIVGVFANAVSPATADAGARRLTVLTYNIQQGSAADGAQDYWGQLEFLRKVNADIIGLQESDTARPSGGNVDAARFFAESLGYYYYYGPNTVSGTFGTAILSRFPLENPRTFFSYSNIDEIGTAVAEIEVGGRRLAFFNSHPAGNHEAHDAHVEALLEEAWKHKHVVAVGDYNFRQSSSYYARVTAPLVDSWLSLYPDATGAPHPRWRETGPDILDMTDRIDHIFVSPDFEVVEAYYVPPPASRTDHPAHWAVIRW